MVFRRVVWQVSTNVSEASAASVFSVENIIHRLEKSKHNMVMYSEVFCDAKNGFIALE
jgi:hypothetical protein